MLNVFKYKLPLRYYSDLGVSPTEKNYKGSMRGE